MSLSTPKLKVVKFSKFYNNSLPMLKVKIQCPKLGEDKLVYAIIDSGSRYTIINEQILTECFSSEELKGKYVDKVIINNNEYDRYSLDFIFPQLDNYKMNINTAVMQFNYLPEEIGLNVILGREDFLKQFIVCMYKLEWLSIYLD